MKQYFLLGVDLEDIRDRIPNGHQFQPRVPEMSARYLAFFRHHKTKATFFVVGDVARRYPTLIQNILSEGHNIFS